METLMDVVPSIEIASEYSLVVCTNQVFDDCSCAGVMIFIIPDRWGTHTPDVAVDPIFSPPGLICLDGWTGTDFGFEVGEDRLCIRLDPMQEFHQFSHTHLHAVQIAQNLSQLAQRQAHHGPQIRNHTGQPHPNASLPKHVLREVHGCFMPFLTGATTSLVNPMLGHPDCWRRWDVY